MSDEEMAQLWEQKWPLVVAKAWSDEAFLASLTADPRKVLKDAGLPLIPNVQAVIVNPETNPIKVPTMCLPVPPKPPGITIQELKTLIENAVVATDCSGTSCCC